MKRILSLTIVIWMCGGASSTCMQVPPGANPPAPGPEKNPSEPGCLVDLSGEWKDSSGKSVLIAHFPQNGKITSTFLEPFICPHRDGQGTTSETTEDFSGTVTGCEIQGEISVCGFGCRPEDESCTLSHNGIRKTDFRATIDPGGMLIEGDWLDDDTGGRVPITYERLCEVNDTPGKGGLEIVNVSPDWVNVAAETGTDFLVASMSLDDCGRSVGFRGPVRGGTVTDISPTGGRVPGETRIEIRLRNGNTITYTFVPSNVHVFEGDKVTSLTDVGIIADACWGVKVEFRDAMGNPIPPDCMEFGF